MINTLTVINYLGEQLTIKLANPFDVGMAITEITGLGPGSADIITTDNATMDGAVYNSSRLSYRNIVITLKLLGTDANGQSIEATRHNVYKYFPIKKPLWLIFESDKRNAMIQGYVESNEPEIFSNWETTQISIVCPNRYFESLNGMVTNFSGVESNFQFPTSLNDEPTFEFSRQYVEGDIDIYYTGEVETGVDINMTFKDHVNPITIYNISTNEKIVVDTNKIESRYGQLEQGDKIVISTTRGSKKAQLIKPNGHLEKTGTKVYTNESIVHINSLSNDFNINSIKTKIVPIQKGTGTPSYNNFREFTEITGVYIYKAKKNMIRIMRTAFPHTHNGITYTKNDDGTIVANGTATDGYSYCSIAWNLDIHPGTVLSGCPEGGSSSTYEMQISDGGRIIRDYGSGANLSENPYGRLESMYAIIREGVTVNNLMFKPMIRYQYTDPEYEPYDGLRYYKELNQTVYCGVLDFISGKLKITHKLFDMNFVGRSVQSEKYSFYSSVVNNIKKPANWEELPDMYCDRARVRTRREVYENNEGICIHQGEGRFYIYYDELSDMSVADAQTWLASNPIKVVYPLETPEVIDLNATSIKLFEGENNIFSVFGTITELETETGNYVPDTFNIINCLDKDLSWFQLHKGDNVFSYSVEGGQEGGLYDLEMTFNNKILYEGL